MLLSLVVIFTQSIQLSKIVELLALRHHSASPSGVLSLTLKDQTSRLRRLTLKHLASIFYSHLMRVVELHGIEPWTLCLQSRCSPN